MERIPRESLLRLRGTVTALNNEFETWRPHYQELAKYFLPRRYIWLSERMISTATESPSQGGVDPNEARNSKSRNSSILDPTGTKALRTLAAGLLNGITSPTRPWLRLRSSTFTNPESTPQSVKAYYEESSRRMLTVLAETNFYNSLAILYLDLSCFGTSAMIVYEDFDDIIRFYNSPMGEYRLAQSERRTVNTFTRTFYMKLHQLIGQFGEENLDPRHKPDIKKGGEALQKYVSVVHLIEPNTPGRPESLPSQFEYREFYWELGRTDGGLLGKAGYREKPGAFPRWELTANDVYGTSPCMDALPDVIQLQHETLRKAQALDKLVNPPIVAESFMANNKSSLLPGSITFAPSSASFGAKAVYTVNPPLGEITRDIAAIQLRISEILHNDLFRMISQLETVRSATEIDARKEEKLVLLGAVLERFENEALDPIIRRVYNIMKRKELLPQPPPEIADEEIQIQYVSILADAQRAVGTVSTERFLQVVGNLASIAPDVLASVNFDELIRDYADRLNVTALGVNDRETAQAAREQNAELQNTREAALVGKDLTGAAKNLSETDLGGGESAIQRLIGG